MGLTETAAVENTRAEHIAAEKSAVADCVTLRAVRADQKLLAAILRLLRPTGRLIHFESEGRPQELGGFQLVRKLAVPSTRALIRVLVPRGTKG
jgi:16S rRNA G527 N7-methylase RsmG